MRFIITILITILCFPALAANVEDLYKYASAGKDENLNKTLTALEKSSDAKTYYEIAKFFTQIPSPYVFKAANFQKAALWYNKAIEKSPNSEDANKARVALAKLVLQGKILVNDSVKIESLLLDALANKNDDAIIPLAEFYTTTHPKKAELYYKKAMTGGSSKSALALANLYKSGGFEEKTPEISSLLSYGVAELKNAANQGNSGAAYNLGKYYAPFKELEDESLKWFMIGADNGSSKSALKALKIILKKALADYYGKAHKYADIVLNEGMPEAAKLIFAEDVSKWQKIGLSNDEIALWLERAIAVLRQKDSSALAKKYNELGMKNKALPYFKQLSEKGIAGATIHLLKIENLSLDKKNLLERLKEQFGTTTPQQKIQAANLIKKPQISKLMNKKYVDLLLYSVRELAESGDIKAQMWMAEYYLSQNEVPDEKAIEWLRKASDNGDGFAAIRLMEFYKTSLKSKSSEAEKYLKRAEALADDQNSELIYKLGLLYLEGIATKKNIKKAYDYFTKAEKLGNIKAGAELGFIILMQGKENSYNQAINTLKKSATAGNVEANSRLGALYSGAYDFPADYKQAEKYYLFAASNGDVDAMHNLGTMLLSGLLGEGKNQEAINLLKHASEAGNNSSTTILAQYYHPKKGKYPNATKWANLLHDSAANGNIDAQYLLGISYSKGIGVARSDADAKRLYSILEEKKFRPALEKLGSARN